MSAARALGLAAIGGGALAVGAWLWRRPRSAARRGDAAVELASRGWVVPVPTLDDRPVAISNEFRASSRAEHLGVDLMYRRREPLDLAALFPPRTTHGTTQFFMPDDVPALAAAAGTVAFASMTPVGHSVIVQHPDGWATYYTHLRALAVARGQVVRAGEVIGTIGASPRDGEHLKHLHFELWRGGKRTGAIDPAPHLATWSRIAMPWPHAEVAMREPAPRNGTLSAYRPVGERGEPYPAWVRALDGKAGVYVIRDRDDHACLYVGSSAGRLYDTLTRHFQTWRRWKGFWKGQYGEGADPGLTYPRGDVEVAVRLTSPRDALDEEMRTIARLRPRDNQIGQPEVAVNDSVPF